MKRTANKRIAQIERKAAPKIQQAVDAAALEEWRQQNSGRIAWNLFVLIQGPKLENPANHTHIVGESEEDKLFVDSHLAYFAMLDRVQKHGWDEEGDLNMAKMSAEERAFAVCLEHLSCHYENDDLLSTGIFNQAMALGIAPALYDGEMSYAEAVQQIDEHRGGPEWRQICDSNEAQAELDSDLEIPTITEIPPPGSAWVDPGNWPK